MKTTDINLERLLEYHPELGKVMLGADRMLIFRQEALSTLRRLMYGQLGAELSRALLAQFGYSCGQGDYASLISAYEWESELDTLTSGPVLHTWEGLVRATPSLIEYDRDTGHFHMVGEWMNSYEAEIHIRQFGESDAPVCHSLTGYASGWSSAFFGAPVVAIETSCVGQGDDMCRFELRDSESWGPEAEAWKRSLESSTVSLVSELETKLKIILEQRQALELLSARQQDAISELSTPILEIWDEVLVLPIVGAVDRQRSEAIMDKLLRAIVQEQARCVILDITGVDVVDTQIADDLLRVTQAAGMLGAYCVVTGVSPAAAQTLVAIGADLSAVQTLRDLKQGLRACLRFLDDSQTAR